MKIMFFFFLSLSKKSSSRLLDTELPCARKLAWAKIIKRKIIGGEYMLKVNEYQR